MQGALNVLQLQVEAESFAELSGLGDHFREVDVVKYADLSTPLYMTDLNETSGDPVDIKKNNWWAEAIHAQPAWDYIDSKTDKPDDYKKIKVAVLEKGKLDKKDDIIDSDSVDVLPVKGTKHTDNHATLVTKIIAADHDPDEIRGVAAGEVDVKFTSMGKHILNDVKIKEGMWKNAKDEDGNVITELFIISLIKSNLEIGVEIFNNSWGFVPDSKALWKEKVKDDSDSEYRKYRAAYQKTSDDVSADLIIAMDELLNNKGKQYDFLIVQSAGNGYSRADEEELSYCSGIATKYTGSFANINDKTYHEALDKLKVDRLDTKLEDILNHIIVVGGAKQTKYGYASPEWAGFGDAVDIVGPAEHLIIDSNKGYDGTSFSAPMVTGTVALIWSEDRDMTGPEVKERLIKGSTMNVWGRNGEKELYPMLNVAGALGIKTDDSVSLPSHNYEDLLETYRTAVTEKWNPIELMEQGLGPSQLNTDFLPEDYGYALMDINNDGVDEMIAGVNFEDGESWIQEIYTIIHETPVKIFASGIRHSAEIHCDGTIEEIAVTSIPEGISEHSFYELGITGIKELKNGYEENAASETYKKLEEPGESGESMTLDEVKGLISRYEATQRINPSFTPFIIKDDEQLVISDEGIEDIVRKSYSMIEKPLGEVYLGELFENYYDYADGQNLYNSGIDTKLDFYKDVHEIFYPEVMDLAIENGMEFLINEAFALFWQPTEPISFYGPAYDLEVLRKDDVSFTVRQTKEIGPQDIGGTSYHIVFIIDYVKEDGKWLFAGAKKQ